MTDLNPEDIAASWIERCGDIEKFDDRVPFLLFAEDQPERCFELILKILPLIPHDLQNEAFLCLSAGPLEEMMGLHGERFIDRVEARAAKDPGFKLLLQNVWRHGMTEAVWERFRKCREMQGSAS